MSAARTIIHTGPGGAGTTTAAAATAAHLAARGRTVLLLALGGGNDLEDVLGVPVAAGEQPELAPRLHARRAAGRAALDAAWPALAQALTTRGARVSAADPPPAPGLDAPAGALALHRAITGGEHDVVVVDAGPPDAALAVLGVPDAVRWWLARAVPQASRLAAAAPPLPGTGLAGTRRAVREALALADLLRDPELVSARVVAGPGPVAARRARRAVTALALQGIGVDAVLRRGADAPLAPEQVAEIVLPEHAGTGTDALAEFGAAAFGTRDPARVLGGGEAETLTVTPDGATLRLPLPFAAREAVSVRQVGDDVVVRVDGEQRILPLPPALADYRPDGAAFTDGALHVTFARQHTPADG